ncbi:MAG: histidine kinase, partial [Verrucomicrobiaceae bacterium]
MSQISNQSDHLRFSSAILRLLGEELNPNPNQGIVELVKNSYDADASWCRVELTGEHLPKGKLRVRDDGDGMSLEDIRSAWLIVGESRKQNTGYSRSRKRLLVGSKGLGRLAALRLGQQVKLITRPRADPQIEHHLEINWTEYEGNVAVDSVPIFIRTLPRELGADDGTDIEISDLHSAWSAAAVKKLSRVLHLLSDPFASRSEHAPLPDFTVTLKCEAFDQIVKEASADYWTHFDYHLDAGVDENGRGWAKVKDGTDRIIFSANHADLTERRNEPYLVPPLSFELWEFKREGKKFATTTISKTALGNWLDEFGGVHLYYRGVRIAPYGDEGNDWLDLNLARARSPEHRPSTNNSVGRVRIEDPSGLLVQKTDRQGFLENASLEHLRQFASDALTWMQKCRLRKRDEARKAEKKETQEKQEKASG